MRVVTLRQLTGDYGTVPPGAVLALRDDYARELLRRGLVREADPEIEPPALIALRRAVEAAYPERRRGQNLKRKVNHERNSTKLQ